LDRFHPGLAVAFVAADDGDRRTEARELNRDRFAESCASAGDDHNFILESAGGEGRRAERRRIGEAAHAATANRFHMPGTPFSSRAPRSSKSMPEPMTRSFTVEETRISPGPALDITRDATWTAIPPMSSPRSSTSPTCRPAR